MALDGIFLHSIIKELNDTMLDARIDKINQPEKDEIILSFKKNRKNYKLLISSSSSYPRIHFTEISKTNPMTPPMFCMVLRKYLTSAKVVSIEQLDSDRVAIINFESTDDLGFNSIYSLIIEIMGRHSNITLVRNRDNLVMDSIKHITSDINSYRNLYPGINYIYPPKSTRLNPFNFNLEDLNSFIHNNDIEFNTKMFSRIFTGISTGLSKEIHYRLEHINVNISEDGINNIYDFLKDFFHSIWQGIFHFATYSKDGALKDFHCIKLNNLSSIKENTYSSPSSLLESYYYEKDKYDRLNSKSADLQKLVQNNLDRCHKKIKLLKKNLEECNDKEDYRLKGELLTANIYAIEKGMEKIEVMNYYSDTEEYLKIKLDENKTPSENVQKYYKKYNKLKKSEEMAKVQIELTEEEKNYLDSVLTNILNVENELEIKEIRNELVEAGYLKHKKDKKNKKEKLSKPMHFLSSDGIDIYVGKNNIQNDYLTLKFASKNDIWMHTKNIPGSHVIIKNDRDIPDRTLEEAANLAAYYSKSKNSTKVPVDYTEVKNVKKPSGAKPGMVIYYTNKTFYIDPKEPSLQKA